MMTDSHAANVYIQHFLQGGKCMHTNDPANVGMNEAPGWLGILSAFKKRKATAPNETARIF